MIVPLYERYGRYLSLLTSPQLKNGSNPPRRGSARVPENGVNRIYELATASAFKRFGSAHRTSFLWSETSTEKFCTWQREAIDGHGNGRQFQ